MSALEIGGLIVCGFGALYVLMIVIAGTVLDKEGRFKWGRKARGR